MVSSSSSELERPCSSSSEQRTAGEAGQCCKREEEEVSWERQGSVKGVFSKTYTFVPIVDGTTYILKDENKMLGDRVKDLEERIAKLERTDSKFQEENDSVDGGVALKESASVTKQDAHSMSFQ
ncbi:hypothetical protein Taro_040394 [Colocasia esculenta]|uniref:Uncharacterized protein n=1 Tax=Colocasia esculenta TaxID=4460 RepID=A0A843WIZ4_COLES|nr:hypothetical protein [Colocasia esculenta]